MGFGEVAQGVEERFHLELDALIHEPYNSTIVLYHKVPISYESINSKCTLDQAMFSKSILDEVIEENEQKCGNSAIPF